MKITATPEWIREQVRRITNGYPPDAIIRELIQNADDAKATWFQAELFDKPSTPKLGALLEPNQPFMLVSNDGPFRHEHRRAISSVLMSAKPEGRGADDIPPIGKFGAGLKSVFSLCEAFFGFHPPFRDTKTHSDGPPGFEVIPGMPVDREDAESGEGFSVLLTERWWNLIESPHELKALYDEIKTLAFRGLGFEGGQSAPQTPPEHLILLIPLRQDVGYPLKDWKCTSTPQRGWVSVQDLWKEVVVEDWDRLWPLLVGAANLRSIRLAYGKEVRNSTAPEPIQRPRRPYVTVQPENWGGVGRIVLEANGQHPSAPSLQNYAFAAFPGEFVDPSAPQTPLTSDSDREALVAREDWPRVKPKRQSEPIQKQKLPAESAVWIYDLKHLDGVQHGDGHRTSTGRSIRAEARWACGLPLAGGNSNTTTRSDRRGRFEPLQVVLHGTFQPDESRTSLVLTGFGGQWNRWLIRRTLGLLPSAVHQFIKDDAPIEASLKIDAMTEGLKGITSPSVEDVEQVCETAFWEVVGAHRAVLPMLSLNNHGLHIDYRLQETPTIKGTRILPIPLTKRQKGHSDSDTPDLLAAAVDELSAAMPGVRAAVSTGALFAVQTVPNNQTLSSFPPSSDQSPWRAWTSFQVRELRPPGTNGHEQFALGVLLALSSQESAKRAFEDPETKRWVIRLITSRVKVIVNGGLVSAQRVANSSSVRGDMTTIEKLAKLVPLHLLYTPMGISSVLSLKLVEASEATDQTHLVLPGELESLTPVQSSGGSSKLPMDVPDLLERLAYACLAWARGEATPATRPRDLHSLCEGLYTVLRWLMPETPSAALPDWWLRLRDADKTVRMLVAGEVAARARITGGPDSSASKPNLLEFLGQGQVVRLPEDLPIEVTRAVFTEQLKDISDLRLVFVPPGWGRILTGSPCSPEAANWLWTCATSERLRAKYTEVRHFEALFTTIRSLLGTACAKPSSVLPVPVWTGGSWTWKHDAFSTAVPSLTLFRADQHSEKLFEAVEAVFPGQVGFVPYTSAAVLGMTSTPVANFPALSAWISGPTFGGNFTPDLEARWKLFEILTGKG